MPIGFNVGGPENDKSKSDKAVHTKKPVNNSKEKVNPDTAVDNEDEFEDDDDFNIEQSKKKPDKKLIYIAVIVIVLVVIVIAYFTMQKKETPAQSDVQDTQYTDNMGSNTDDKDAFGVQKYDDYGIPVTENPNDYIYDENGNPVYSKEDNSVVNDDALDPGAADYSNSDKNTTTSKTYDSNETLKDINGVDINATYNVVSRDYLYDYVSYTAKRGIIDDGMEIYWLDADYHGKKYRIQVPFYYFKDFEEKGVCKVQVEVLNIEGGGKVISYMQVVDNDAGVDRSDD